MYYLLSRYYDPQTGRFINADTPDYLDPKTINGLNLYSYCNNNPVMNVDPSGHELLSVAATFVVLQVFACLILGAAFLAFVHWIYSYDFDTKKQSSKNKHLSSSDVSTIAEAGISGVSGPKNYMNANGNPYNVGWGSYTPGYTGFGGSIAGDPLLYMNLFGDETYKPWESGNN